MIRKNKIIIALFVILIVGLTLGLVLGGLDRLDVEKYGINYNIITADFSDTFVYLGGLHLVGPSNVLLQVTKNQQAIWLKNLRTYTKDFFPLQLSVQARYQIVLPVNSADTTQNFTIIKKFYINFGAQPEKILEPIIRNQIVKYASNLSSIDYQNSNNYKSLQLQISEAAKNIISKWSNLKITILISSIVCRGVSFNVEDLNRKINGLLSHLQRTQARKIEMTNLLDTIQNSGKLKSQIIKNAINRKITVSKSLKNNKFNIYGTVLSSADIISTDYSYASPKLQLRPEMYLLNNSTHY